MPFAFFSVINQPTLHQYFHVQLYKFRFVKFISALYHKNNDTVYHSNNIQCRCFYLKRHLTNFRLQVSFSCHKVSSHSSSGSLLMTRSGLDGSRTRVQKPFPCSSTIIVSCLNFPQVIEN